MAYFSLLLLIYDYLYSVSLKTLPFFKALTLFYDSLYSFSSLFQGYIDLVNIMIHLDLSLLRICNFFSVQEYFLKW